MAEGKSSFVMYSDWISVFDKLTDQEAGVLIKHIFAYVNDLDPEPKDRLTEIAFEPIKQTLKRDLRKWEGETGTRSDAGKLGNLKRWHPELYKQVINGEISLEIALRQIGSHPIANVANVAVSVSVSDSDNGSDNVRGSDKSQNLTPNQAFGKRFTETRSQMENGLRVLKGLNLSQREENLLHLLRQFTIMLDAKGETKSTYKDYSAHFISWLTHNGAKFGLKKPAQ
jgi:Family of unknown function (DUF6291)